MNGAEQSERFLRSQQLPRRRKEAVGGPKGMQGSSTEILATATSGKALQHKYCTVAVPSPKKKPPVSISILSYTYDTS